MAAPAPVGTGDVGATDAGGAWSFTLPSLNLVAGMVVIVQILQDGNTDGALSSIVGTNIEDLAGTDNVWTQIPGENADGSFICGSPAAARQHIFIGRSLGGAPTISGGNSTSEDLYRTSFAFSDVSTGTTLATVIENASAGAAVNAVGTGTTAVPDTAVQTLGPDRFAVNMWAANDDATGFTLSGSSGGDTDWTNLNSFESASGTDGTVNSKGAVMSTAGTINGASSGTLNVSVSWGMVGFALIGTTAGGNTYTKAGYGKEHG